MESMDKAMLLLFAMLFGAMVFLVSFIVAVAAAGGGCGQ